MGYLPFIIRTRGITPSSWLEWPNFKKESTALETTKRELGEFEMNHDLDHKSRFCIALQMHAHAKPGSWLLPLSMGTNLFARESRLMRYESSWEGLFQSDKYAISPLKASNWWRFSLFAITRLLETHRCEKWRRKMSFESRVRES